MEITAPDDFTHLPHLETLPVAPPEQPTVRYSIDQYYQERVSNAVFQGDPLHHYGDEYGYSYQTIDTNSYLCIRGQDPTYDPYENMPDAMVIATAGSSQCSLVIDNAVTQYNNQSFMFTESSLGIQNPVSHTPSSLGIQNPVAHVSSSVEQIQPAPPYN